MKFLLLVCLWIHAFNAEITDISNEYHNIQGFYWRDYNTGGDIPSDALPCGTDNKGNSIYCAQALLRDTCSVVPGHIRSTTKRMTFEMRSKEVQGTQDIKILCTVHPEQFQWIKSVDKTKASTFLKGKQQFITSGIDPAGGEVIIGRASVKDEILVGKVIITPKDAFYGVHIGDNGKGFPITSFEVLVYDPSLPENTELCHSRIVNITVV